MNITCQNCRASVPETALVCPACGHDFAPAPPQAMGAGSATPFGPVGFGAPLAAPSAAPQTGESEAMLALVFSIVGLVACGPVSFVGLFLGLRARARALAQRRSATVATAAIAVSALACVIWALLFVRYQRLFFASHHGE